MFLTNAFSLSLDPPWCVGRAASSLHAMRLRQPRFNLSFSIRLCDSPYVLQVLTGWRVFACNHLTLPWSMVQHRIRQVRVLNTHFAAFLPR